MSSGLDPNRSGPDKIGKADALLKYRTINSGEKNVRPILCNASSTGLADKSVDAAFFFGLPRIVGGLERVLVEMHRILKPQGTLAFRNSRGSDQKLIKKLENQGMSYFCKQGKIIRFQRN